MASAVPQLILGTGTFGASWGAENLEQMVPMLKEAGIDRIDTAALYPMTTPREAERMLGEAGVGDQFILDTKVMYTSDGAGTMTEPAVDASVKESLEKLKISGFNVLYLHGPDKVTPIAEQAAAVDAAYRKGTFKKWGVCNMDTDKLIEWIEVANAKGYIKPSVFQGQYNLLSRSYEETLFPLLRENNIAFIAFSPLAGGFLTGKLTLAKSDDELKGTRFEASDKNLGGAAFRFWYDKPNMHEAVRKVDALCREYDVPMSEAAVRWLLFHSALVGNPENGIIVGPRNPDQLSGYVKAKKAGPMPDKLADGLTSVWDIVKDDAKSIVQY